MVFRFVFPAKICLAFFRKTREGARLPGYGRLAVQQISAHCLVVEEAEALSGILRWHIRLCLEYYGKYRPVLIYFHMMTFKESCARALIFQLTLILIQ